MSLNNLQLSAQLLSGLYKEVLVEPATGKALEEPIRFLGKNNKGILIMVSNENVAFLEDAELSFLTNILNACKLNISDVAIINQKHLTKTFSYSALNNYFNSTIILLFAVDATSIDLPFQFPNFQVQQFDKCTYLSAPALKEIEQDKVLKSKLWAC